MRLSFVAAAAYVLLVTPGALRAAPVTTSDETRPAVTSTAAGRTGRTDGPRTSGRGTIAPAAPNTAGLPAPVTGARRTVMADSIVIEKSMRRMTLFNAGLPVRTYDVALGRNPVGRKERIGDYRTPEGLYHIDARNPFSRYHRGLHVSYPNADDLARARTTGIPAGGDIMIHGLPNGQGSAGAAHREFDWTNGCVAVTDDEIDEIWASVPVGTPVRIKP